MPARGTGNRSEFMRVTEVLTADHARLRALLAQATGQPFDRAAFEQFRAGLLRHIGIEEKLVFAEVRRRLGGQFEARRQKRARIPACAKNPSPS